MASKRDEAKPEKEECKNEVRHPPIDTLETILNETKSKILGSDTKPIEVPVAKIESKVKPIPTEII